MFADAEGGRIRPHPISRTFERLARRAGVPVIRLHDLRHTHGTMLIKGLIPVKVVGERLGHAYTAFTIETSQHVLPGMQRDAAHTFGALIASGAPPGTASNSANRSSTREIAAQAVEPHPSSGGPRPADLSLHASLGGGGRI